MAKGDKKKDSKPSDTGRDRQPVTSDDRFKAVHNDPRFRLPQLKNFKVKVDERFSKKELRKLNASSSGKSARIDRYGRKITASEAEKDLDKFYEHEEESGEEEDDIADDVLREEDEAADSESDESKEDDEEEDVEDELRALDEVSALDRARGEGLGSSSESDSEPESDSDSDSESESEEESESEIEDEQEKPEEGDPTSGFAVVNMDWDNIKAVDLMATFLSFVPSGGSIKSVTIYPSEFGKEQMQKEEIEGPPRELFKSKKNKKEEESDSDSDSDIDLDVNNREDMEKATRKLFEEDDGEEDYDSKALRRYQLQRLRYYYAVVKCDSVNTAKSIYDNCDGTEYESTANIFDLRYVPDDMEFDDESKDECTKIPSSYKPDSTFVTDALQHSKVKLTWDETPKERLTLSSRPLSQKEIEEMDFKAYLASDTDGSENEEEDKREAKDKYKNLLGGSFNFSGGAKSDGEDDVDMEITFDPGMKEAEQKEENDGEEQESTIDAYRRKEKERRQRRMAKFKGTKAAEKDETDVKESETKKSKNRKHNKKPQIDEKSKAELELIMMDENNESKNEEHFNMRDVIKSEKQKNKKGRKSKNIDTEMTQDNFHVDLNDPRFSEVFEKHDFAIDPTNSEFKKTDTMKKILKERSNRKRGHSSMDKSQYKKSKKDSYKQSQENGSEVGSLVNKIKQKYRK
ncbi:hypothetical protein G9P44_000565 [Scheffersomyces stipitis]|nr:hypothetical protein G9P44_000565 [Scheffersomyces stipitis]